MFSIKSSRSVRSLAAFALLAASVVTFTACPQRTSIYKITSNPSRYANKEVAIAGRVTDSYGALGTGLYEIDDGTGRMWVFVRGAGVPSRGARIGAKGYVHNGFTVAGRNFATVLEETDRRTQKY